MSTLPEITEALCKAYLRSEWNRLQSLCSQAAAKMQGERGARIQAELDKRCGLQPARPMLNHWTQVFGSRSAPAPRSVVSAVEQWALEVSCADRLVEAGERVQPLLLVGPTRCGKTSTAVSLATRFDLPVYRLSLANAVGQFLGETSKKMQEALKEITQPAVWLIDELDAIAQTRGGGKDGSDKERSHAVGWLLTALDELHASTPLIATTNMVANIDAAVVARFQVVEWPCWNDLPAAERAAFAAAHGSQRESCSYADAVAKGRADRVKKLLAADKEVAA